MKLIVLLYYDQYFILIFSHILQWLKCKKKGKKCKKKVQKYKKRVQRKLKLKFGWRSFPCSWPKRTPLLRRCFPLFSIFRSNLSFQLRFFCSGFGLHRLFSFLSSLILPYHDIKISIIAFPRCSTTVCPSAIILDPAHCIVEAIKWGQELTTHLFNCFRVPHFHKKKRSFLRFFWKIIDFSSPLTNHPPLTKM